MNHEHPKSGPKVFREKVVVFTKLQDVLHPVDGGLWQYAEGWSDARVAEEVGWAIQALRTLRAREFGRLYRTVDPRREKHQDDRLSRIEKRLARLERIFDAADCLTEGTDEQENNHAE